MIEEFIVLGIHIMLWVSIILVFGKVFYYICIPPELRKNGIIYYIKQYRQYRRTKYLKSFLTKQEE